MSEIGRKGTLGGPRARIMRAGARRPRELERKAAAAGW